MPAMEELNERFRADRFAAQAGVEIREAEPGRALCAMPLRPCHMNANGAPMGGAIFTLADFAYAVASNGFTDRIIVSQQVAITFLAPARGTELLAEEGGNFRPAGGVDGAAGGGKVPEIRADHLPLCGGRAGRAGDLCGPRHGEWIYGKIRIFSSFGEPDGGALRLNG